MSFSYDTIWPMRLDLSELECRQILREKELICYSDVLSVLRAQGPLTDEKKSVISSLQKILSINEDRNKAEFRKVSNNEKLATIAEVVSGYDGYAEWSDMGTLKFPPTFRPTPKTVYCDQACQTSNSISANEKSLSEPNDTPNFETMEKHETAIFNNRILNKDKKYKSEVVSKSCSTQANNDKTANQDLFKSSKIKEVTTSHDYNLHLLSEIATGESNQTDIVDTIVPPISIANIKPDHFSIRSQINDIEESVTETITTSAPMPIIPIASRPVATSNILLPGSNVVIGTNMKNISSHQESQQIGMSNSVPVVISNPIGSQRIVLPRNSTAQGINLISNQTKPQQQHHSITSFLSHQSQQQQQQSQSGNTYLSLSNSQLRSPTNQQIGNTLTWNNQQQQSQQPQVYISNVSHNMNIQHNPGMENLAALGFTLQQRAVRAEQHQTNNKGNLIVRNLGNQVNMEPERNKRFMLLKGGGTMGPTSKKSKISNPSNRQPGRPPLMPAPSSAYTSRPYVANEIFNTSRCSSMSGTNSTAAGMVMAPSSESASADSVNNGVRISSVSSRAATNPVAGQGQAGVVGAGGSSSSSYSSQLKATNSAASAAASGSFYPLSRGNGLQQQQHKYGGTNSLSNSATAASASGNTIQLGAHNSIRCINPCASNTAGSSVAPSTDNGAGKQKTTMQPVISVVPLSPVSGGAAASSGNFCGAVSSPQPVSASLPGSGGVGLNCRRTSLHLSHHGGQHQDSSLCNTPAAGDSSGLLTSVTPTSVASVASVKVVSKDEVYAGHLEKSAPVLIMGSSESSKSQ